MNNFSNKLDTFLDKITIFANLQDKEREDFIHNVNQSILLSFLSDGANIVSPEILNKLKSSPDQTVIQAYLKEMSESEAGKKIIQDRLSELLNTILDSIKDKLTQSQKDELLKILE